LLIKKRSHFIRASGTAALD